MCVCERERERKTESVIALPDLFSLKGRAYVVYSGDSAAYRMFLNYKCIWFVNQDDNFAAITEK